MYTGRTMTEVPDRELDRELRATRSITVEGDIIRISFNIPELNEERHVRSVALMLDDMEAIFAAHPGKNFYGLGDLTPLANKISHMSKRVREGYLRIVEHPRVIKAAVFGANKYFEVATNFIISALGKSEKLKIFKTEVEARAWLKQ